MGKFFGEFGLTEDDNIPENSSKAGRLPMFFNNIHEPDINKVTVEDFLFYSYSRDIDEYFDRQKILAFLEKKAQRFEDEIFAKVFCPKCKSSNVVRAMDKNGLFKGYYHCLKCKRKFKVKGFINSRFPDGELAVILANFAQGKRPREIFQLLVTEKTNHFLDYGVLEKIPDEKTLYDIREKCAKKLQKFNDLMILLMGGIPCRTLFCDDAFAPRRRKKQRRHVRAKRRRRKKKRFYYAILSMDADSRFIICLYIAPFRDKKSFLNAFGKTEERLKGHPEIIRGDKLAAMQKAAEIFFPKNLVKHDFRKLKPWEKGDLMKIERKIRDVRKTVRKRQKFGSLKVLANLAVLAVINLNYLNPMQKALGGRSPAQAVGIPYPFCPHDWRKFMVWVDWVFEHISEILKAGLKQLPGTYLVPSAESNEKLFKERTKLKKRKREKKY